MRLTVFNGSPRGKKSNTKIMLDKVLAGYQEESEAEVQIIYLMDSKARAAADGEFAAADLVLLGFPLYTDAMPGLVKEFIESLAPFAGIEDNPRMAFMVQSGFPEAHHSRFVERYLEKLARRLKAPYAGTIVKGGCEGVRLMPDRMNRKLFESLQALGKDLARQGQFDPEKLRSLAKPERYPKILTPVFKLLLATPLVQIYWNNQLKQHDAFNRRFDRPFTSDE